MTGLSDYLAPLPLVAVLRGITPSEISAVGSALTEHGFRILEVPLNSPEPFDSIKRLAELYGERCLTGAGTVVKVSDVARVADAGGQLIVMPHGDVAIVREAKRLGLVCLPGVATPTEAFAALDAGADGLKMFPGRAAVAGRAEGLACRAAERNAGVPGRWHPARQHGALLGRRRGRIRHRLESVQAGRLGRQVRAAAAAYAAGFRALPRER